MQTFLTKIVDLRDPGCSGARVVSRSIRTKDVLARE